jgi:hypothetical protein
MSTVRIFVLFRWLPPPATGHHASGMEIAINSADA